MRRVPGSGVTLAVHEQGEGMPVLLLHGFPNDASVWRRQVPVLAEAGFRTIAPDLRGFGESDRPAEVSEYAIARSVADCAAVLDALGVERAHVVGHDFGAVVAWVLAAVLPERVERLVALSVGHPGTGRRRSLEARQKGWYQLLFQFTGVAEELLRRDDWKFMRELLGPEGDLERAIEQLERPGALTAGLNWYRANLHPRRELEARGRLPAVAAPTLGLWSTGERFLTEEAMVASGEHVDGPWRYERIEGASHWLQLDAPDEVNRLILEWLT